MRAYEILKEYEEYGSYGGWASSKNEIFGTDTPRAHLELINKQGFASYESAFEAGWVRIIWTDAGWTLEGMPKDVKRTFRRISKRFFMEAGTSTMLNFTLYVALLADPMNRYTEVIDKRFIMPQDKAKLIQFMNGL